MPCSPVLVRLSADENGYCIRTLKFLQGMASGLWIVDYSCKPCPLTLRSPGHDLTTLTLHGVPLYCIHTHISRGKGLPEGWYPAT